MPLSCYGVSFFFHMVSETILISFTEQLIARKNQTLR
jgi:hypothetical protein